jgi:hypothetical protein
MELYISTTKLKKDLKTKDFRCVHHGWNGTHWYDIQILATHTSTWVHQYSSLLQWSVHLGQRGLVEMVGRIPGVWNIPQKKSQGIMSGDFGKFSKLFIPRKYGLVCRRVLCVLCTKCSLHSNQTYSCDIPTHIHSHRLAAEMWTTMKNTLLGKNVLSCSFYLYRFLKYVSNGFPIINYCNPGVHYETPCIYMYARKIHNMLKLLRPYLNLDTALCLYFDLDHQRFALLIQPGDFRCHDEEWRWY